MSLFKEQFIDYFKYNVEYNEYDKYKNELRNKKILLVGVSDTSSDLAEELKNDNEIERW